MLQIDNGRYDTLEAVRANARRVGARHAVLWDQQGRTTTRFKVPGYPYAMLVGPDGVVQWAGHPSKDVARLERGLQGKLAARTREEARPAAPAGAKPVYTAENWARDHGCTEMGSDTWLDNEGSINAHKKTGYYEVDRLVHFIKKL